jgi:hypothetical protein
MSELPYKYISAQEPVLEIDFAGACFTQEAANMILTMARDSFRDDPVLIHISLRNVNRKTRPKVTVEYPSEFSKTERGL